jgi:hypothetical protein
MAWSGRYTFREDGANHFIAQRQALLPRTGAQALGKM